MTLRHFIGLSLITVFVSVRPCSGFSGQAADSELKFEVASVKLAVETSGRPEMQSTPSSLTFRRVSILSCVMWAYEVHHYQIKAPQGVRYYDHVYDIVAKTAGGASDSMRRAMMRSLLKERFGLSFHREQMPTPTYELLVAKGGPKLSASKEEALPDPAEVRTQAFLEGLARSGITKQTRESYELQHVSMAEFAEDLVSLGTVDHPVADRTGIEGYFDISL